MPVAPATNKCGIFARLATTGLPLISFPSPMDNVDLELANASEASTSFRLIISRTSLGISKPITGFPGITSTIRTLSTNKARAKSLLRFMICETLTPGAKESSN